MPIGGVVRDVVANCRWRSDAFRNAKTEPIQNGVCDFKSSHDHNTSGKCEEEKNAEHDALTFSYHSSLHSFVLFVLNDNARTDCRQH